MKKIILSSLGVVVLGAASFAASFIKVEKSDGTVVKYHVGEINKVYIDIEPELILTPGCYEYVDLGLSVEWATFNIGATKPEEYGAYFAWGETKPKNVYSWQTYKWSEGSETTLTKYNTKHSYGKVDDITNLLPEDDAATVNWGNEWRMPTYEEQLELLNYCDWEWTELNGIKGYEITGFNGNSIFLPVAGEIIDEKEDRVGDTGYYWLSSLSVNSLYFYSNNHREFNTCRYRGLTIRPVHVTNN
ncbi:MAG: hypothetical protein IKV67_05130 [Paludibacteraceae bacterium]|nr:hypothetical protein [Paludibacteraceae bacterium]